MSRHQITPKQRRKIGRREKRGFVLAILRQLAEELSEYKVLYNKEIVVTVLLFLLNLTFYLLILFNLGGR